MPHFQSWRLIMSATFLLGATSTNGQPSSRSDAWTKFAGINCYNGVGGATRDPNNSSDPAVHHQSVQQCQASCMAAPWCAGVVYGSDGDCWLRAAINLQYCQRDKRSTYYTTYTNGRDPFKWIRDFEYTGGKKTLGAGIYYIDRQYVMPKGSSLVGVGQGKTFIQAVRWRAEDAKSICGANAKHRIGLIVGDGTYLGKFTYTGVDTFRPGDNGELCAGDAIEFPGCDDPYCSSHGYTGRGDGNGATNVLIEEIDFTKNTVQNMVFIPQTDKGKRVSSNVHIRHLRTQGTWADGLNIHGAHQNILVEECSAFNTGDDCFALWDSGNEGEFAYNITFKNNQASNPHFNGNNRDCYSQFGGRRVNYIGNHCNNPTHAMIHYWIQFCGSGQLGSPGKSICYPNDAVSIVQGNILADGGSRVKEILKDDRNGRPKIIQDNSTQQTFPKFLHV